MKLFKFKLEHLLELRRFREQEAEGLLAAKAGVCAMLDRQLEENALRTHDLGRERFRTGGSMTDFLAAEHYSARLVAEREKLLKSLALAEAEREVARLAYIETYKSRELIDKLREREEKAWYKLARKEEVAVLDELGAQAKQRLRREQDQRHQQDQEKG
ncbi:MAG: flagellar export protein FliJ [Spirochaetes bacterium]|nr:flagellar export protein FliJ [Spirochaetota bacterium]MBU0955331.1 flagellar export protein FliJ [Spirochaetota bacterium]